MSLTKQLLVGLIAGIALGIFLGEHVAPIKLLADAFVKLLQMTVLPYLTVSIVSSLGNLDYKEARRLGLKAGAVLGMLWIIGILYALLLPLVFPGHPKWRLLQHNADRAAAAAELS